MRSPSGWLAFASSALLTGFAFAVPRYHAAPALDPQDVWAPLPVQRADLDGLEVAYIDAGPRDAQPVVFVHGLSSYMGFWEHQLPAFADDYRVIALDLPGYGASSRPDAAYTPSWYAQVVVDLLDELGVDDAVWVGHSMGGQVSLTAALNHPSRVRALVLSAPAGFETFQDAHADWMIDYWTEGRALEAREEDLRATFTTLVFNHYDEGVERLLEERVRMGKHPDFQGTSVAVSRSVAGMLNEPVYDRLGEIEQPALVVFGTHDKMIPNAVFNGGRTVSVAKRGVDALPNAELVMVPRAGHTVHHDAPDAFNSATVRFLEGL